MCIRDRQRSVLGDSELKVARVALHDCQFGGVDRMAIAEANGTAQHEKCCRMPSRQRERHAVTGRQAQVPDVDRGESSGWAGGVAVAAGNDAHRALSLIHI